MRNHKRAARRRARTSKVARLCFGDRLTGQAKHSRAYEQKYEREMARINSKLYGQLNTI